MTEPLDAAALHAVVTERDRPDKCVICSGIGDDVWGVEGVQLQLCQRCRIRWRRYHGKADYDDE